LARTDRTAQLGIAHRDVQRRVQIPQRHPGHDLAEARLFPGTVVTPVAIPLVDDVVVLGVEPAAELGVTAKRVDRTMVVPAPIDVARAALVAPHVAELRIAHRLPCLAPRGPEVPGGAIESAVAH